MEVTKKAVISQVVRFEGITEDAKYTISGNASIYSGGVQSVDTGEVVYQGSTVASFSQYSESNSNISFSNVATTAQKVEIMTVVDEFMAAVAESVTE